MVKDISIVIVSWNVVELLEKNLEQLFLLPCKHSFEVFVVDNGSSDGTPQMLRDKFPQVHLIQNDYGSGFSHANNQAFRLVNGKVVLMLNPDMMVNAGALEMTYEKLMADKTIGVLGIRLNDENGKPINSVRRWPTFFSQLVILLKLGKLFPKLLDHYHYVDFDYTKTQDVPQVRGSFFAFRKDVLEKFGGLDERFFIWFEEVDFCRQVINQGMRVVYVADVTAHDLVGRSFAKMKHLEKQLIFTESMYRYFWKWGPKWQAVVIYALRPIGIVFAYLADVRNWLKGNTDKKIHG